MHFDSFLDDLCNFSLHGLREEQVLSVCITISTRFELFINVHLA